MSDINLISYTQMIPVTNIGIHSQGTLFVEGKDITPAKSVFINGVSATSFIVLSKTKLIVDLPTSEINKPINSVAIAGNTGEVGFVSFSVKPQANITDSKYVIQRFFNVLLKEPNSDVFNPGSGVGLLSKLGNIDFEDVEVLVAGGIREAEQFIIQTQKPELADSKTLVTVNILNVSYSITTLTASVAVQFELADGTTAYTDFNIAS